MGLKPKKPIKFTCSDLELELVGRIDTDQPYIAASTGVKSMGFLRDQDLKRLRSWCDECLESLKKSEGES